MVPVLRAPVTAALCTLALTFGVAAGVPYAYADPSPSASAEQVAPASVVTVNVPVKKLGFDAQATLDRLNQIRKEACDEGITLPASQHQEAKTLTPQDYVPLQWNSEMDKDSFLRAVEAAVFTDHMRPAGGYFWSIPGNIATAENLAWYPADPHNPIISAVNGWYSEKEFVTDHPEKAGHYFAMINPALKSTSLSMVEIPGSTYNPTTAQLLTQRDGAALTSPNVSGEETTQSISIQISDPKFVVDSVKAQAPSEITVGEAGKVSLSFNMTSISDEGWEPNIIKDLAVTSDLPWVSDHPEFVSVAANGALEAKAPGTATLSVDFKGKTATVSVTAKAKEEPAVVPPTTEDQNNQEDQGGAGSSENKPGSEVQPGGQPAGGDASHQGGSDSNPTGGVTGDQGNSGSTPGSTSDGGEQGTGNNDQGAGHDNAGTGAGSGEAGEDPAPAVSENEGTVALGSGVDALKNASNSKVVVAPLGQDSPLPQGSYLVVSNPFREADGSSIDAGPFAFTLDTMIKNPAQYNIKEIDPSKPISVIAAFDVTAYDKAHEVIEPTGKLNITLTFSTPLFEDESASFVLVHFAPNPTVVPAALSNGGKTLSFTVDSLSPFAVLDGALYEDPKPATPDTNDASSNTENGKADASTNTENGKADASTNTENGKADATTNTESGSTADNSAQTDPADKNTAGTQTDPADKTDAGTQAGSGKQDVGVGTEPNPADPQGKPAEGVDPKPADPKPADPKPSVDPQPAKPEPSGDPVAKPGSEQPKPQPETSPVAKPEAPKTSEAGTQTQEASPVAEKSKTEDAATQTEPAQAQADQAKTSAKEDNKLPAAGDAAALSAVALLGVAGACAALTLRKKLS